SDTSASCELPAEIADTFLPRLIKSVLADINTATLSAPDALLSEEFQYFCTSASTSCAAAGAAGTEPPDSSPPSDRALKFASNLPLLSCNWANAASMPRAAPSA